MDDPSVVEKRLGIYADRVLNETRHGWPIGRYLGVAAAQGAEHLVQLLVNANTDPIGQGPDETTEEYVERLTSARAGVEAQLDEAEDAFMDQAIGNSPTPELLPGKTRAF